jgi:hypothetical protein
MPSGKPFFSLGVCCVTPGDPWLEYHPDNPGYAAFKQYPDALSWVNATVDRLHAWGFTTVGGWSDNDTLKKSKGMNLPYTLVLHMGMTAGAPWWDMWDPKILGTMDSVAKKQILAVKNDPRLLGYFTDNEMGWWNAALFKMTLEHPAKSVQRQKLLALLKSRYASWDKLTRDFIPVGAASFADLDKKGVLYLRPGGAGIQMERAFLELAARRYYAVCKQIIRKYDKRGLILGDRYQSFYYPEVAAAAHDDTDVVSSNVNPNWSDGGIARFYLDTIHALAQRPVYVGEFYMAARENRSGNGNNSSGFPVVQTQEQRAEGFKTTASAFLSLPYVVGADWFQYADEPGKGRGDGENYDMGLVDVNDQPYAPLTAAAASLNLTALHSAPVAHRANATEGVPHAPQEPLTAANAMEALKSWDRERGFVPCLSKNPTADLYLCWDKDAVYVGLYAMDIPEDTYYRDKKIPEQDRLQWTIQPDDGGIPIVVRLGSGRLPTVTGPEAQVVDLSGKDGSVRTIAAVRIPVALFGRHLLHPGESVRIQSRLLTSARARYMEWSGEFTLRD